MFHENTQDELHHQAEKTINDWNEMLKVHKLMVKHADHDLQKVARQFVQAETRAKTTKQALEQTVDIVNRLLKERPCQ